MPETDTEFSVDELNLLREWCHSMQDCIPTCLEQCDYDLADKIYGKLGLLDTHPRGDQGFVPTRHPGIRSS